MKYALVRAAIAFGAGIWLAEWIGAVLPLWVWPLGASGALVLSLVVRQRPLVRKAALLTAVACLGALRVACVHPFPEWLRLRTPALEAVEGTIVSYPSVGSSYVSFTLRPDVLPGLLLVYWFRDAPPLGAVHYGDRVRVSGAGRIPEPFDGFDYPEYLARQGIFATMSIDHDGLERIEDSGRSLLARGDRLRQAILAALDRLLPADESGMARGLLFGDRTALSGRIEAAFSRTGLMHLLAVSGLHLGIFLGGAWWAVRRLGVRPRWAYPMIGSLVLMVLWIIGPKTSLVRAGLLFGFLALGSVLADLGVILRRCVHPLNGLAAAAVAMLAMRPGALYDAGFQLTFAATASILVLFSEPFRWGARIAEYAALFGRLEKPMRAALSLVAVSAAAQVGATPIIAWHFEAFHPLSVATNLVAVPLAGISLWCGLGASVLSGTLVLPKAIVPFFASLRGLKTIVVGLAGIPFAELHVPRWMGVWLAAFVGFALACAAYLSDSPGWTLNSTSIASAAPAGGRSGRPRRMSDHTTSASPAASVRRPGTTRRNPPRKSAPRE